MEHLNQKEKWLEAKHQILNVQSTQEGAAKEQRLAPMSDNCSGVTGIHFL